jgi:hypothetical protein
MTIQFDATASMLGYLFQVRVALLDSLKQLRAVGSFTVSVEALYDVAFQSTCLPTPRCLNLTETRRRPPSPS